MSDKEALPVEAWLQIERDSKDAIARTSLPRYYDRERWEFAELVRADAAAAALAQRDARISELWQAAADQQERITRQESEIAALREQVESLNVTLQTIGDFAHDRSTGPAVPDALWEVRSMAYDGMEPLAAGQAGKGADHG